MRGQGSQQHWLAFTSMVIVIKLSVCIIVDVICCGDCLMWLYFVQFLTRGHFEMRPIQRKEQLIFG